MYLKRLLVIVPTIFVFLLCNVFSFGVSAEDSAINIPDRPPMQTGCYATNDYIASNVAGSLGNSYLIVYAYKIEPSSSYDVFFRTVTYYLKLDNISCELLDTPNGSWYLFNGRVRLHNFSGSYTIKNGNADSVVGGHGYSDVSNVGYDPDLEEVYINDGQSLLSSGYVYSSVIFCFNGEIIGKSSIEVETFPRLEGKSTLNMYQLNDDGVPDFSKPNTAFSSTQLIDVDIINNTIDDYQFALYFVEKGGNLRFYESMSDFNVGAKFFSNNPQYIYITDEWYYYSIGSASHSFIRGPSAWHIVKSGEKFTCHVGENQLQFKKDVEYDIVVVGCPAKPHKNTYFDSIDDRYLISGIDPYINLNSDESLIPKELYRSTFYLDRDTAYKNTSYSNDDNFSYANSLVYGFDPYGNNDDTFNTYYMKQDAVGSDSISDIIGGYGLNSFNQNLGSNDLFFRNNTSSSSSYTSSFAYRYSDFFGFIRSFLSCLPPEFMNIFIYGFTAVVSIGIIKAVRS